MSGTRRRSASRGGAGAMNNRVSVHPPLETRDDFGDVLHGYTPAFAAWMAIARSGGELRDAGAGEQPFAAARAECWALVDVRERYVLVVERGPEAGTLWKVTNSCAAGRGKRELTLETFTGPDPRGPADAGAEPGP